MGVRIKSLLSVAVLSTAATVSSPANAQERTPVFQPREVIPATVNRTFYGSLGDFSDRNPLRPIGTILGTPFGFPENQTSRDAQRINRLYRDLLNQQVANDPIIRTADLPNPFSQSVLTLPSANRRVAGSEFSIDQPLPVQPMSAPMPTTESSQALPQRF
jgi:hypothetical protein